MKPWEFYDKNAIRLFNDYISLNFFEIFQDVTHLFKDSVHNVLDVGAGSGRDASALSAMGYNVTAVEPSTKMRELASSYYQSTKITWIDDSLPSLVKLADKKNFFDLILISAVWMHLTEKERLLSLNTLKELLSPLGSIIITLRLGPEEPDRDIKPLKTDEVIESATASGFNIDYVSSIKEDSFNRTNIKWQKIVLTRPIN